MELLKKYSKIEKKGDVFDWMGILWNNERVFIAYCFKGVTVKIVIIYYYNVLLFIYGYNIYPFCDRHQNILINFKLFAKALRFSTKFHWSIVIQRVSQNIELLKRKTSAWSNNLKLDMRSVFKQDEITEWVIDYRLLSDMESVQG